MVNAKKKRNNQEITTYEKLINIGKASEKAISNLKIEDLKDITNDPHVLNIIALRECIKNHNTLEYFNYKPKIERKEET